MYLNTNTEILLLEEEYLNTNTHQMLFRKSILDIKRILFYLLKFSNWIAQNLTRTGGDNYIVDLVCTYIPLFGVCTEYTIAHATLMYLE